MKQYKGCIFIVEDEIRIRRMLSDFFKSNGYTILEAKDGKEAIDLFYTYTNNIDLVLLDVMMPHIDGLEVLEVIREVSMVPVIMLTAKSQEYDQLNGFKNGADDYITKPFSPTLLLARIQAVLKRTGRNKEEKILAGNVTIDDQKKTVRCMEEEIDLTPKEYDLLMYFIENKGIVVSRQNILNSVWNYDYMGDIRTVDTHIKQLRAKLTSNCNYIKTVHGRGYRFEVSDEIIN